MNNIPKIHQEMFNLRKHRNLSKITLQRSLANFLNAIHYLYHQQFTVSNIDLTKAYLLKTKTSKISSSSTCPNVQHIKTAILSKQNASRRQRHLPLASSSKFVTSHGTRRAATRPSWHRGKCKFPQTRFLFPRRAA